MGSKEWYDTIHSRPATPVQPPALAIRLVYSTKDKILSVDEDRSDANLDRDTFKEFFTNIGFESPDASDALTDRSDLVRDNHLPHIESPSTEGQPEDFSSPPDT